MTLTPEQIEARRHVIGGSDAPAALGLSPWRTPVDLYMEKCGVPTAFEPTEKMDWGNLLEPVIRDEWARRHGKRVAVVPRSMTSRAFPFMGANLDAALVDEDAGLEVKTVSGAACNEWGEDGTDQVPLAYLVQVYHYAIVTEIPRWYVAALFNGSELRSYTVDVRKDLAAKIVEQETAFWSCVQRREPPPPMTPEDAAKLWPVSQPVKVEATAEVLTRLAALKELRANIDRMTTEADAHKTFITSFMGTGDTLVAQGKTLATWKTAKDSVKIDADALRAKAPEVAKRFSVTTPGSRRFLVK